MFNPIAKKHLRGFLSEGLILDWYFTYKWTFNWSFEDWSCFIKSINSNMKEFYEISDKLDYKIKVSLFVIFYKDSTISRLLLPLAIYILQNEKKEFYGAGFIPNELGDDDIIPVSHFDGKIFEFREILNRENILSSDDIVSIIYNILQPESNFKDTEYDSKQIFNLLTSKWKENINKTSEDSNLKIIDIIKILIENKSGIYLPDFSLNLNFLSDDSKEYILNKIFEKKDKASLDNEYYLYLVIYYLLNLSEKHRAESLFENFRKNADVQLIKDVLRAIRSNRINHILREKAETLAMQYLAKDIEIENEKQSKINNIDSLTKKMLDNECNIILSKNLLIQEIDKINEFLISKKSNSDRLARHNIYELTSERIKKNISFYYDNSYTVPPVFSDFTINFIKSCYRENNYTDAIALAKRNANFWFSKNTLFWRFFFWHYISVYSEEKAKDFLEKNPKIKDQVLNSLEIDVKNQISTLTVENVDLCKNALFQWLTPFILSINILYDNNFPEWFPKEKLCILTVYSSWHLKTTDGMLDSNFPWLDSKSVFDWLENIVKCDKNMLVEKSLSYYSKLTSPESKAQLLLYYLNNFESLNIYKTDILEIVLRETSTELKRDCSKHKSNVLNWKVLSGFWQNTTENYIDELMNSIPFETYQSQNENSCFTAIIDYFIRVSTTSQKEIIIEKYKKHRNEKNICQLLSTLGDEKSNIKIIRSYLKGKKIQSNLYFSQDNILRQNKKSIKMLFWYLRLLNYSLKKNSPRRNSLYSISQSGIRKNITSKNFIIVRFFLLKLIKHRRNNLEYFEGLLDFLDELEQIAFNKN